MAVKTVEYAANTAASTSRGPSASIWYNCPAIASMMGNSPDSGMSFWDDFLMSGNNAVTAAAISIGQWGAYFAANGALDTDPNLEGGVIALTSGANSTVNCTMASTSGAFRMLTTSTLALNQKLWFECRVAVGSITTAKRDCFIGLCDNTVNITSAANTVINSSTNTLATAPNLFGFHFRSTTNPTDVGLAFNVAAGTVQYPTNLQTLVNTVTGSALAAYSAGTGFVKLGFIFDPNAVPAVINTASSGQTVGVVARPMIQVFVNGLPAPAFLTAAANIQVATFPTGFMSPVISFESRSSSSPGDFYIDWIRVAQLGNS